MLRCGRNLLRGRGLARAFGGAATGVPPGSGVSFELTSEQTDLQARVQRFVQDVVVPFEADPRRQGHGVEDSLRQELIEAARAEGGLLGSHISPEFGGLGHDHRTEHGRPHGGGEHGTRQRSPNNSSGHLESQSFKQKQRKNKAGTNRNPMEHGLFRSIRVDGNNAQA